MICRSHIVLMGFMAVGKSTVGKVLAERLKVPYIDTDQLIEQEAGMTISDIFGLRGESHFREMENEVLRKVLAASPSVIATGGGLPCSDENIALIQSQSLSVTLLLGEDKIIERLLRVSDRPLVGQLSEKELKKMVKSKLKSRRRYYNKGKIKVRAIGSPSEVADRIVTKLKRET